MAGEKLSAFEAQIEVLGKMRVLNLSEFGGTHVSFTLVEPHDGQMSFSGAIAGIRDSHRLFLLVDGKTIQIPWSKIDPESFKGA